MQGAKGMEMLELSYKMNFDLVEECIKDVNVSSRFDSTAIDREFAVDRLRSLSSEERSELRLKIMEQLCVEPLPEGRHYLPNEEFAKSREVSGLQSFARRAEFLQILHRRLLRADEEEMSFGDKITSENYLSGLPIKDDNQPYDPDFNSRDFEGWIRKRNSNELEYHNWLAAGREDRLRMSPYDARLDRAR